jgi:hypothetical protein
MPDLLFVEVPTIPGIISGWKGGKRYPSQCPNNGQGCKSVFLYEFHGFKSIIISADG